MTTRTTQRVMTPRERLLAFLRGEPTDRVPMWLLFPFAPLGCYVNVQAHPAYRGVFEASKDRAIMLNRRTLAPPLHTPEVECSEESLIEHGWQVQRRRWRYRNVDLTWERREAGHKVIQKPLLDSAEDLEAFAELPIETDADRIAAVLDQQLPRYLADRDAFPRRYGAMMLDLGEPIGSLYQNANLEEYAIWSVTHRELVESILDRLMQRYRAIYQYALDRQLAEVYFLVGSELASPPLVSRDTFTRWVVPYAQELVSMIHKHDNHAIQHYHGQIRDILSDFLTMGADALHTIEEPPVGNCTLPEAFDIVGDRMGLIGCIQYDCFRSYTPEQMRQAVRDQVAGLRDQRFMLSPSAGPFENDPDPRVFENYHAFIDAAWNQ